MRISGVLFGCIFAVLGTQAQAGFQWTAPVGGIQERPGIANRNIQPPAQISPQMSAAPVAPVMSESLPGSMDAIGSGAPTPIATVPDGPASAAPIYGNGMTNDPVTWNVPSNASAAPTPIIAQPNTPQQMMPTQHSAQNSAPTPMMAGANYGSSYEVAQGFGSDLPLVMAIRQVVPDQFNFVFDDGIDLSTRVSWQGGRPWNVVLQDVLSPLALNAGLQGNVVSITRQQKTMTATPVAMTAQMPTGPQVMSETMQSGGHQMNAQAVAMMPTPVMTAPLSPTVTKMSGVSGYMNTATYSDTADLNANTNWVAPRGSTLRTILEDWSDRVGVELYWASEYDYPVQSAVSVQGTFEEAVQTLLRGLAESRPRPLGRLHPNLPNGPAVLVIETRQGSQQF